MKKVKSGVWFRHGAFEVMAERPGVATCSCPKAVVSSSETADQPGPWRGLEKTTGPWSLLSTWAGASTGGQCSFASSFRPFSVSEGRVAALLLDFSVGAVSPHGGLAAFPRWRSPSPASLTEAFGSVQAPEGSQSPRAAEHRPL